MGNTDIVTILVAKYWSDINNWLLNAEPAMNIKKPIYNLKITLLRYCKHDPERNNFTRSPRAI